MPFAAGNAVDSDDVGTPGSPFAVDSDGVSSGDCSVGLVNNDCALTCDLICEA
ncbi:hypothetical protein [Burkholderia multivorans]|uniref:hypothetical protein n=1 Tax=Burkholderia multivorans TaxID=87883 RepID=UPI0021BF69FE|nr:hypothetical protein [Burkholderia multivorans]